MTDGSPTWWLDELAHAGPEHLDPAYVAGYDMKAPTEWGDDIEKLRTLGIGEASTVVDIGAGTGRFALAIAPYVRRVVAVDVSAAMVEAMRGRGIEAVQAGFLSYEHVGDPADLVLSRNALHHLPDFWKALALRRIAAMLKPGGIFVLEDLIFSFPLPEAEGAIERWIAAAPTDPRRGWTREQLAEHVRVEYSTFTWLLEPMLDRAGLVVDETWTSENGIYAAYRCRRAPGSRV